MNYSIRRKVLILLLLSIFFTYTGCATLFSGGHDEISLSSEPIGAKVLVNGMNRGKTPIMLNLKKGKEYQIEFVKEGFETRNLTLSYSLGAGWLILDILFGLIPIIVDVATGDWNGFDYDAYKANLDPVNK
jgi:hypothetical protein